MEEIFKLIGDLGFPIAVALAGGYFVYLTIKLLLQGVLGSINGMKGIIIALDNRVKTMNHDVVRIDTIVSNALGLKPDVDRIARADGKMMQEETKDYLSQLVIDLHYQASQTGKIELRKIADDISDILKRETEECYT